MKSMVDAVVQGKKRRKVAVDSLVVSKNVLPLHPQSRENNWYLG